MERMRGHPDAEGISIKSMFGLPHWFTFHAWNLVVICDAIMKYVLYSTDTFGQYNTRRGILSMYVQQYSGFLITFGYLYTLGAEMEKDFRVYWLYKIHIVVLGMVSACYALDGTFFMIEKHTFCNMQLESRKTCDSRNEYFMLQVGFYFVFWLPLWILCADSMRRYSHELSIAEKGKAGGRYLRDDFGDEPVDMRNLF